MRKILKHITAVTYKPILSRWLSKKRIYRSGDIILEIPKGVFHPGFFFSTQLLLKYINTIEIKGKNFLELGAGSGLISILAAKRGAKVTATDINPDAVEFLEKNAGKNKAPLTIILSDLFQEIPPGPFDIIAINPPYYKKKPLQVSDFAWYCGENGEYFQKLFNELRSYIHKDSEVLFVLSEECDIDMIEKMAAARGLSLRKVLTKKLIWEYLYIYKITGI